MSDFESSLNWVLQKLSIKHELKSEQKQAMQSICSGYHTFVILPTGYGKSYIYGLSPLIMDKVHIDVMEFITIKYRPPWDNLYLLDTQF